MKGQQNCTQQVWDTHDAPTASESLSIRKFITIKRTTTKIREFAIRTNNSLGEILERGRSLLDQTLQPVREYSSPVANTKRTAMTNQIALSTNSIQLNR
jgi:hypothetical protein